MNEWIINYKVKKFVQFHFFLLKRLSHKTKNTQIFQRQYIIDIYIPIIHHV